MDITSKDVDHLANTFWDSPAGSFIQQVSYYAKTPDNVNFVFWDDIERQCIGGFTITRGNLSFLTDEENYHHVCKLQNIFIKHNYRGSGLFRSFLEALKGFSEDHGVLLYFLARSFKLDMPTIRTPEEYVEWISTEDGGINMHHDHDKEWYLSRRLYDSYRRIGFCGFRIEKEDVEEEKWLSNTLCNDISNIKEDLRENIISRINCEENKETLESIVAGSIAEKRSRRRNRHRIIRKKRSRKAG